MGRHERSSHAFVSRQRLERSMRAACGTCEAVHAREVVRVNGRPTESSEGGVGHVTSSEAVCGTCCQRGGGAAPSAKSHSQRASTRSMSSSSASMAAPPYAARAGGEDAEVKSQAEGSGGRESQQTLEQVVARFVPWLSRKR